MPLLQEPSVTPSPRARHPLRRGALALAVLGLAAWSAQAAPPGADAPRDAAPPPALTAPAAPMPPGKGPAADVPPAPPGGPGVLPPPAGPDHAGPRERPGRPDRDDKRGPGDKRDRDVRGVTVNSEGVVQRFLLNPYGEVDGLQLADGAIVKFPPHMGEALAAHVQPGQAVRAMGRSEFGGTLDAEAIVNVATGRSLIEQRPPRGVGEPMPKHLRAASLQSLQAEGRIATVLVGRRGEANGVILDNGSIVRFPPHGVRTVLQAGQPFAATGLGTRNALGTSLEAVSLGTTLASVQPLYSSRSPAAPLVTDAPAGTTLR